MAVTPNGKYVLSVGDSGEFRDTRTVCMSDLRTGRIQKRVDMPTAQVAITPDGDYVLLSDGRLWSPATGEWHGTPSENFAPPLAIIADGKRVLSGPGLRLWRLGTGECIAKYGINVTCIAASPDGRYAVSGSMDRTLRFWDLTRGECVATLREHAMAISVAFSPDGNYVASANYARTGDNVIHLWYLDWDYDFPDLTDWDDGAKPYLEVFLALHRPYADDWITKTGHPKWHEDRFQKLLVELQYRGYGWLRPEGVRKKLEDMAANWQGPPPPPGQ